MYSSLKLRPLDTAAVVVAVIAAVIALLFPHLRESVALVSLGLSLAWIRQRFFHLPGVSGVPFQRMGRLLRGRRDLTRKAKAA